MQTGEMIRQGDVQIVAIEAPKNLGEEIKPRARGLVLADGEATGHAHAIKLAQDHPEQAQLFADPSNDNASMLLLIKDRSMDIDHEEHKTVNLQPGWYRISQKREFDAEHGFERTVAD